MIRHTSCLVLLKLILLGTAALASPDKARPNILIAFADDWGRHAGIFASIDGEGTVNDLVKTPHLDSLAKQGVVFNNTFVSAPSCTPCRSSLLSGQHFWRTGMGSILFGAKWDTNIPAFPLLLKDGGYHIGKTFKVWSPGEVRDAPYGGTKFDYSQAGTKSRQFSQSVNAAMKMGKSPEQAREMLLDEIRSNFRHFLNDRKEGQPFCYWYGPTNVHRSWIKGSGKTQWGLDPGGLMEKMPPFLPDVHEIREDLADYMGEVQNFDLAVGTLVEELRKTGELENTIIIISGDHGPPGFPYGKCNLYDFGSQVPLFISGPGIEGGRVLTDLVSLPDLAPTLLEACQVDIPEVMTAKSLWPSLKSDQKGLADASRTAAFIGRERHIDDARPDNVPYPQRAIRTHDHLFIINFKPDRWPLGNPFKLDTGEEPTVKQLAQDTMVTIKDEDAGPTKAWMVTHRHEEKWKGYFERAYGKRPMYELYDIKKDPHQINNVANDPTYKEVMEKLRDRLLKELKKTADPRMKDDGKFFEKWPMTKIKE